MNMRHATSDDLAVIAELFGSAEEAVFGRSSRLNSATVEGWLQTVPWETNTWLFEEDGVLVAGAFGRLFGDRGNWAGAVRPSATGRGLGQRLIDLVEERLESDGTRRLHSWTVGGDDSADSLFRANGYHEVRRFWDMWIELEEEPSEPPVAAETFAEDDARAFHAALEEAFADHWEHHPEPFDEWWDRQGQRENYDPSVWFLIRDGDEVAAVCRNEERPDGGYVGALGVRRPWRGKGYGKALLLHSFREFRRRGHTRASLGVDAANPTGATQLYESVGMRAEEEYIVWEKVLG
jgi:mycothiol synthase